MPSSYGSIGQGRTSPITPTDAPATAIKQLWSNRADPWSPSRSRILACRDMRRNITRVQIDPDWLMGDDNLREWVETLSPDRQMIGLNLTNTLGDEIPVISRHAIGQTDRAQDDADEAEVFCEALKRELVDWDEIIGKITEDSELAVLVYPSPAGLEYAPDYMTSIEDDEGEWKRTPHPRYDRDKDGRGSDHERYSGRSERASIKAWSDEYKSYLSTNLPITVRLVPATDCAPILVMGMGKNRFDCRGLVVRTLFDREELIARNYRWDKMDKVESIPRGFVSSRTSGQAGQYYLYEAFLIYVDAETGDETPFIARSVGGYSTTMLNKDTGAEESAVVDLRDEYGITKLMVGYFWGLHASDDDPSYRGIPLLWPVMNTLLAREGVTTAIKAHVRDNAFTGHIMTPDPNLSERILLDAQGNPRILKKPKANEIVQSTGPTTPWPQAQVGQDAWRLLEVQDRQVQLNKPDPQQFGDDSSDSGHAMVVGHELLTAAKRQIREGGRQAVEFIIESAIELCCGLARGHWKQAPAGVNVCLSQDVQRTIDRTGAERTVNEVLEFKERWFGENYNVTARYPSTGNLAERRQTFDDWGAGAGTFAEMRASRGDQSPETTRFEIARDKWIESEIGQATLAALVAEKRGQNELAAKLKMQIDGQMTQIGMPTDALAPELSGGAPAGAGPGQLPNMAANSLNGAIQGQVGTAAREADALAVNQVAPGAPV